ncbi:MAG: hypothetical protein BAJATHORv1_100054 [Candidatus Thorarchaeota archaeon]|nr:MAG: hypothetical protein BAJATHORv1_100054 [Candidatus Thorarchaeota archaeon]
MLDLIDKQILLDLTANCRSTYRELSQKHGLTANAIKNRIKNLEKSGVIREYIIRPSIAMADCEIVYGLAKTDGAQDDVQMVKEIGEFPGIQAAAAYTGAVYYFFADYQETRDILNLRNHIRSIEGVGDIEIHTILRQKGGKMELTQYHCEVLETLSNNPRMSITELVERTSIAAKRARRVVREIEESNAIYFTIALKLGAGSDIPFILEIDTDIQKLNYDDIIRWLTDTYPIAFWDSYCSALKPKIFALFAVDTLTELNGITRTVREQAFATSVKARVATFHRYFPGFSGIAFQKRIEEGCK